LAEYFSSCKAFPYKGFPFSERSILPFCQPTEKTEKEEC
jgi:hypothetical protein